MNLMQLLAVCFMGLIFAGAVILLLILRKKRKIALIKKNSIVKVSEKDRKKDILYVECEPLTDDNLNLSWIEKRKREKIKKKNPDTFVMVRMELNNGKFREFLVNDKNSCFFFNDKQYVFDYQLKYNILDRDLWAYDFSENFILPFKKNFVMSEKLQKAFNYELGKPINPRFDTNAVNELIECTELIDIEASLNPKTAKRFNDSEIIKQVLQGAMLGRVLKVILIILIIIGVLVLIVFMLGLYQSGIFEKIGNLFHKK